MSSVWGQPTQEKFVVQLQTPTGQQLPSIEYDGQRYFVGEPGQEFVVAVERSLHYPHRVYRVDGKRAGYRHYMEDLGKPYLFKGWLESGTSGGTFYRHFKLASCQPDTAAAAVDSADDIAVGRIQLDLCEVTPTGCNRPVRGRGALPQSEADKRLPEGKKWFMAPGLKAEAGSHATGAGFSKRSVQEVATLPSIHVRYDSSEALYLRKALNPSNWEHRAILRKSANPAVAALGAEPTGASSGAGAAEAGAGGLVMQHGAGIKHDPAGVKHEAGGVKYEASGAKSEAGGLRCDPDGVKRETAGVKREREAGGAGGDDDHVPRSASANRVDLTEQPVLPMCVNGRQLARDEFAVCDLCDSDDEGAAAPKWEVQKKQLISVDL